MKTVNIILWKHNENILWQKADQITKKPNQQRKQVEARSKILPIHRKEEEQSQTNKYVQIHKKPTPSKSV